MNDTPRKLISLSGTDHHRFLQDLVTNDLQGLERGLVYAALLTPQGKYLFDFFVVPRPQGVLIDVAADRAQALIQRLTLYRLRADVQITEADAQVTRGLGAPPEGAFADPRCPALGWRGYDGQTGESADWDRIRVAHCVPQTGVELIPEQSYILECGFERLNGVDFRKGCYVGQEVTARMRHKTVLRKGLRTVAIEGRAAPGTEILSAGKPAGVLHTSAGDRAIAYLRFDRVSEDMTAGSARLRVLAE